MAQREKKAAAAQEPTVKSEKAPKKKPAKEPAEGKA
jgi:hypothetical protein